jgi:hypothetical protein
MGPSGSVPDQNIVGGLTQPYEIPYRGLKLPRVSAARSTFSVGSWARAADVSRATNGSFWVDPASSIPHAQMAAFGAQLTLSESRLSDRFAPKAVLPVNPRRPAAGMDLTVGPLSANSPSLSTQTIDR